MNLQGTNTGRWSSGRYHEVWKQWNKHSQQRKRVSKYWRAMRERMERRVIKALRMEKQANKAFNKRMKMKRSHGIESLVRRKNDVYHKWRAEHDFAPIEEACIECMLRFGALPRWEEYVQASRRRHFTRMEFIQKEHAQWRKEVREWAMRNGITRFPIQSTQFLKFYFAWWRYEHEKRNGPVTREYGRQMG